jgi:hypothetical protein
MRLSASTGSKSPEAPMENTLKFSSVAISHDFPSPSGHAKTKSASDSTRLKTGRETPIEAIVSHTFIFPTNLIFVNLRHTKAISLAINATLRNVNHCPRPRDMTGLHTLSKQQQSTLRDCAADCPTRSSRE